MAANRDYPPVTPNTYKATLPANIEFEFVSAHTIFPYVLGLAGSPYQTTNIYIQEVFVDNESVFKNTYKIFRILQSETYSGQDIGTKIVLKNNSVYKVVYTFETANAHGGENFTNTVSYTFAAVENKLPLKKWTITDVINRLLDLAEPIRKGEKPRFKLNGMRSDGTVITPKNKQDGEEVGQAYLFDKILSPELSFTKETLRECLQEVGKVVHGEPRLKPKKDEVLNEIETKTFTNGECAFGNYVGNNYDVRKTYNVKTSEGMTTASFVKRNVPLNPLPVYYMVLADNNKYSGEVIIYNVVNQWFYEITYDLYAGQEDSNVLYMPYTTKSCQHTIENYASYLDSSAENLVNQLDKYSGVIVEPYKGGAKSVRTENQYVRIEDGNMIIATQFPIYSVEKLEAIGMSGKAVNITAWLFEKSIYDTQLTSYTEAYPYSKAYGLYYTQGEKNIGGLNFKLDKATFAAFNNYAITNILKKANPDNKVLFSDYPALAFRVTYTPFYNARVAQTKQFIKDFKRPAALIFNQQSNVIESRYYGENLKGAIARLGNVEASLTYLVSGIKQIPKAGQKFNKDYYISAVAVELLPTAVKFTIGLSKDFNRLSQYIGISSSKRFYEVSQNQSVERNVLYREYIVVGEKEEPDSDSLIGPTMLAMMALTFAPTAVSLGPITNVVAWGTSAQGNDLQAVNLPVISSAFGNSVSFSWKYDDNYSAGPTSEYKEDAFEGGVSGYFQNDCKYTDYYGRLYYYNFDLQLAGEQIDMYNYQITRDLPAGEKVSASSGLVSTVGKEPFILRKDNREALQVNFQIDFVTNIESLIIGSALASYSPLVRGSDSKLTPKLYVFPTELNKFTDHIEAFEDVDLQSMPTASVRATLDSGGEFFVVSADSFPASGKSWAIVTNQYTETKTVEDEQGNQYEQTEYFGGDLLIGQNMEVTAGQAFTPIYFTKKREVFDKSVWKDRR